MESTTPPTMLASLYILFVLGTGPTSGLNEEQPTVWIYRDVPSSKEDDPRSPTELVFLPFCIFPASAARNVSINNSFDAVRLDPDDKGTCCEFDFLVKGPDYFAGVRFIPDGGWPGEKSGIDLRRMLFLGNDRRKRVVLRFRARCETGNKANVRFSIGGTAGGQYQDSLRFPKQVQPSPTKLTDRWSDHVIDLTGKPENLESIICPLQVLVVGNDNPSTERVTVYVDDVRFAVEKPGPSATSNAN